MAIISSVIFSVLVFPLFLTAAPSENNVATTRNYETLDIIPIEIADKRQIENESASSKRQKRFYDYIDFKYPPFYPASLSYPAQSHYSKRDESAHTAAYGPDEAFSHIFRRLRDILTEARQLAQTPPVPPAPPVTHFTGFVPLLYIPPVGCRCNNPAHHDNRKATTPFTGDTNTPTPAVNSNNQPIPDVETTTPDLNNRFFDIDDKRRNWGILINSTQSSLNEENDGNRPISFDPVVPDEAIDVPVPPVEHGSVQAGIVPEEAARAPIVPSAPKAPVRTTTAPPSPYPTTRPQFNAPSICDTAVIACCVQSNIAPTCFAQHGCPDTSIYGNPCDPDVVLNLVNKVQFYIKQRNA